MVQSHQQFVGQNTPTIRVVQNLVSHQQTNFVEQSKASNYPQQQYHQHTNFVELKKASNYPQQQQQQQQHQQTNFVEQSKASNYQPQQQQQQQTNFVEQNKASYYQQQQQHPLTSTHSFGQTSVGQSALEQPIQFVEQHRQQPVGQNQVASTQINFFDQNDVGENLLRESRHNYVFRNATFEDEGDEIDTPSDRIYRGWELDPHEFPWMVKLMVSHIPK